MIELVDLSPFAPSLPVRPTLGPSPPTLPGLVPSVPLLSRRVPSAPPLPASTSQAQQVSTFQAPVSADPAQQVSTSQAPAQQASTSSPPVASVQPTPRELDADRLRLLLPQEQHAAVTQVYAGATPGTRAESDPLYRRSSPPTSEPGSNF